MIVGTVLLVALALTLTGCGSKDPYVGSWGSYGLLRIEKKGDTYYFHDTANPFGNEYQGKVVDGKLVAHDGPATFTYVREGDWLVMDDTIRYEKN